VRHQPKGVCLAGDKLERSVSGSLIPQTGAGWRSGGKKWVLHSLHWEKKKETNLGLKGRSRGAEG